MFLPWLLVSCGRLDPRHIAHIASSRSLGAILELNLVGGSTLSYAPSDGTSAGGGTGSGSAGAVPSNGAPAGVPGSGGGGGQPAPAGGAASGSGSGGGGAPPPLAVRGSEATLSTADAARVSFPALLGE